MKIQIILMTKDEAKNIENKNDVSMFPMIFSLLKVNCGYQS